MNGLFLCVILSAFWLAGCSTEPEQKPVSPVADHALPVADYTDSMSFILQEEVSAGNRLKAERLTFGVKVVSATTFVRRTSGQEPVEPGLADETVVMLEMALPNSQKDLFESPRLLMTRDDIATYFSGAVEQDVTVEQGGKIYNANGVSYEGRSMSNQKLRLLCFFKGLDLEKRAQVRYYDRLFGLGLMKFNINEPSAL